MTSDWETCLAIILKEEGGNDDDPDDPGGRTSRGIIQREWNVFRQTHPNRPQDVWQASDADVATIYHDQYWAPYCDNLPAGIDLVFFNTSVNSGRQQAVKELQRSLGISADGMMGMITFNALNAYHDIPSLIKDLCDRRRAYYKQLKTFWKYGNGWLARTDRIEVSALDLAAKSPGRVVSSEHPQVDTIPSKPEITVSSKALPSQVNKTALPPEASGSATAGLGSLIAIIDQIKHQLSEFTGTFQSIQYVLLVLTIIGICYTIYTVIQRNRTQQAIG